MELFARSVSSSAQTILPLFQPLIEIPRGGQVLEDGECLVERRTNPIVAYILSVPVRRATERVEEYWDNGGSWTS